MRFLGRTPSLLSREKGELVCSGRQTVPGGDGSLSLSPLQAQHAQVNSELCVEKDHLPLPCCRLNQEIGFLTLVFDCYYRKRSSGTLLASV